MRDDKSFPYICHRRSRGAADHQASRRPHRQGRLLRPLRQRLGGQPHRERPAARVPAALLHGQLLREPHAALPALPDQALLRPLHRRDPARRVRRASPRRRATFLAGKSNAVKEQHRAEEMQAAAENLEFERAARYRDRIARSVGDPGRAGHQPASRRGGGRLRPRRAGRPVLRRGVLLPQLPELGQPRLLPARPTSRWRRTRCWPPSWPSSTTTSRRRA